MYAGYSVNSANQSQAKHFLIDKILAQSAFERSPLSEDERWMLGFSECDPEFVVDIERIDRFERAVPSDQFEAKIAALVERACARDAGSDSTAVETYLNAQHAVKQGDHYIALMVESGLKRRARPWWAFWR